MPELPEVETVCRVMRRALQGRTLVDAVVADDPIVLARESPDTIRKALVGHCVKGIGRKGKFWWIELEGSPCLAGHLGMAGWIRELGQPTARLREHGTKPLDDEEGRPRFLKLLMEADSGARVAFTDGRRLGRLWLTADPESDPRIAALGPDVRDAPRSAAELHDILSKRKAPIKAAMLDQKLFAGVGNWIADETLYQAGIAPARLGQTLSRKEIERLLEALKAILEGAIAVGADSTKYPEQWLFSRRWGGKRGTRESIEGHAIVRETIGGRTTAWVPDRQH